MSDTDGIVPTDINNPRSVAATLSDMIEMASQAHANCDIDSETECGGEQYGDGSADEHCRLRDAEATVKLLKRKATQEVTAPHSDLFTIDLGHDQGLRGLTSVFGEEG